MSTILNDLGIVLLLIGLGAFALIVRRILLRRAGAGLDLCIRRAGRTHWTLGLARYSGDRVEWFRMFSPAWRPGRTFQRSDLVVTNRRTPSAHEAVAFVHGATVLECVDSAGTRVDLCLPEPALTGFQAWLESTPPGAPRVDRSALHHRPSHPGSSS